MITVWVADPTTGGTIIRTAQIVSEAPGHRAHWARTCDRLPAAWLLVSEHDDSQGRTTYDGTEYNQPDTAG